jgi:hypothetical protein
MHTRVDRPAFRFPVPRFESRAVQTGSLLAFPLPDDVVEPSRWATTVNTRSGAIHALLRIFLRAVSLSAKTPHLHALRWFMLGTFAGLAFACCLILSIRVPETAPARRAAVLETSGARTMVLLRPAIAFERTPAGATVKAPVTPPRVTTTTSTPSKRSASTRMASSLFAAALAP